MQAAETFLSARRRRTVGVALKGLVLVLLVGGCWGCLMPLAPSPGLPDKALFQEGDILVSFDGKVESWFFILGLWPDRTDTAKAFSHAEMVFRDASGALMVGGVSGGRLTADPLLSGIRRTEKFVLFRAGAPLAQRVEAARFLRAAVSGPAASRKGFDWSLTYRPGPADRVFCAGVINEACRRAGLPLPFESVNWRPNPVTRHLEEILDVHFSTTLSVTSIFDSQHYTRRLSWNNPGVDRDAVNVNREIVRYLLGAYDRGLRLRGAKKEGGTEKDGALGQRAADPGERLARFRLSLHRFQKKVFQRWNTDVRHGRLEGKRPAFKDQWVGRICDAYGDDYFSALDMAGMVTGGLRP